MRTGDTEVVEARLELLERDELLDGFERAFEEAGAGRGRLVLLGGEAGVGKTALLRAFCGADRGGRVLWGACERLFTPRALGPFLDIADTVGLEFGTLPPHARAPYELLGLLAGELVREPPTVLVVEDVHWADVGTLDVLKLLARRIEGWPVLAIVSFRDDQLTHSAPLQIVLGELAGARAVERCHISPLSLEAVRTLAEPAGTDAERLFERTSGNPFFVTEALAAGELELPESVRGAVLARAAHLPAPARRLLEAAAVVPARIELWLLEAIAGPELAALEDCLSSGMLREDGDGLQFRHELARLAIEESVAPHRRIALHRAVLDTLCSRSRHESIDPARLAHHADAAGDVDAVLRHAPAAGERAAELCAHQQAAQQFARALRHADLLPVDRRAELWERRSYECYLTQQTREALAARREALALHRERGDRLREGDSHRWLSRLAWFDGDRATAVQEARLAIELLEGEPPGRELAMAYSNQAQLCMLADDMPGTIAAGTRAIELAERLGETETLAHALNNVGAAEALHYHPGGVEKLERSLALALEAGLEEHVARGYTNLGAGAVRLRRYADADRYLTAGLAYCEEHDLDAWVAYMTGWVARLHFDQGRWDAAAEHARAVLSGANVAVASRIEPLAMLGRLRARRGDPGAWEVLDEALALARGSDELQRLAPVAAARAEAHCLEGNPIATAGETEDALAMALAVGDRLAAGELYAWRQRAGLDDRVDLDAVAEPFASELRGDWLSAARRWDELGCSYEAALARADSGEEVQIERALAAFQRLGALPAARVATQRLRLRGVRSIARGPRRSTLENPGQLTARQIEILSLLSDGLTNAEIAERLYITPKTAAHHVSAILGKLGVRSRRQAVAAAAELRLLEK
jgi:DNA-binding CsgD family transcriptional regulator/tetratricopeptide (TPR) repeat protein